MPRPRNDGTPARVPNKRKLTELLLQKPRVRANTYLIWDTLQRNLALAIHPTGNQAFKCIYAAMGRARWYHLGNARAIGLGNARKLAQQIMFEVSQGKDPLAHKAAQRGHGTFAELADRYLNEYAKVHNKSWRQGRRQVERFLLPRWGQLSASDVTRADALALLGRIEAPALRNLVQANGSALFHWALQKQVGGVTVNPFAGIERNKVNSRERVLTDSEIAQFWPLFDQAGVVGCALKVLLSTGQRPGEVANMRREHIKDGWWEMPSKPEVGWPGTKNGASHRVWLPTQVQTLLAQSKGEGFVWGREPLNTKQLSKKMQEFCRDLGVTSARPHDLRRTHGTMITRLGFGRDAMNRIQNHREGGIASVYDRHQYADENKRVMETVARHILALAEGQAPQKVIAFARA